MKQKVYKCVIRLRGELINTVPLEGVTKDELRLLAFIHGTEAIPSSELKYLGEQEVFYEEASTDDGAVMKRMVESQMDEYRRLARKYDSLVSTGRGKTLVEECFKTRLDDFDNLVNVESAEEFADRVAKEAEAKLEIAAGGEAKAEAMRTHDAAITQHGAIGSKLAESVSQRGRN